MKITNEQLNEIITEETQLVLLEQAMQIAGIVDSVCANQKVVQMALNNPNIATTIARFSPQAQQIIKQVNPILKQVLGTDIVGLAKNEKLKNSVIAIMGTICKMRSGGQGQ